VASAVVGRAAWILKSRNALANYFPVEPPNHAARDASIAASVPILAVEKSGQRFDQGKFTDTREPFGLAISGTGATLNFDRADNQTSRRNASRLCRVEVSAEKQDLPWDRKHRTNCSATGAEMTGRRR
jgi:hypothetical protein